MKNVTLLLDFDFLLSSKIALLHWWCNPAFSLEKFTNISEEEIGGSSQNCQPVCVYVRDGRGGAGEDENPQGRAKARKLTDPKIWQKF